MAENSKLKDLIIDLKDAVNRLDYEIVIEQNVKSVRAQNLIQEIVCTVWSIRAEIQNPSPKPIQAAIDHITAEAALLQED